MTCACGFDAKTLEALGDHVADQHLVRSSRYFELGSRRSSYSVRCWCGQIFFITGGSELRDLRRFGTHLTNDGKDEVASHFLAYHL